MKSKGRRIWQPHDQIWTKMQFRSPYSIQIYQIGIFIKGKDLLGECQAFLPPWCPKANANFLTRKYTYAKLQFCINYSTQMYHTATFFNGERLIGGKLIIFEKKLSLDDQILIKINACLELIFYFIVPGGNFLSNESIYWGSVKHF